MLNSLIESRIAAEERSLGEDLDYLKYMLRASRPAFFRYMRVIPAARFRRTLPPGPFHAAAILASMHEGCGNCAQIEINMAKACGVSDETLLAVVENRPDELSDEVRDSYLFTQAVLMESCAQDQLRLRIVERFGDEGLVELSLKMAVSRVFPVMTRALGFASSCAAVELRG